MAPGLEAILQYHNDFVATKCRKVIANTADDCVNSYEEIMCVIEEGLLDSTGRIDACDSATIEFPLFVGQDVAYAAPTLTVPDEFKLNCPKYNCKIARKYAFPILDQLAPFCPFFGVGISSRYTIEGFSYGTLIPDDPEDVFVIEVDPSRDVDEFVYMDTAEATSQFRIIETNALTAATEDPNKLKEVTNIKTKSEGKKASWCGGEGKGTGDDTRRLGAESMYDVDPDELYEKPSRARLGHRRAARAMQEEAGVQKDSSWKNVVTPALQGEDDAQKLPFCADTWYENNCTSFTFPANDTDIAQGSRVIFTEATATNSGIQTWDPDGDGFVTCGEARVNCALFDDVFGVKNGRVPVDVFFRRFIPAGAGNGKQ